MTRWNKSVLTWLALLPLLNFPLPGQDNRDDPAGSGGKGAFSGETDGDLFDYTHSLKFARYLRTTRQYDFATEEYERLRFFYPEDPVILLELVETYRLDGNCSMLGETYGLLTGTGQLKTPSFTREYLNYCLACTHPHPAYFNLAKSLPPGDKAFYTLGYYWQTDQLDSAAVFAHSHPSLLKGSYRELYLHTVDYTAQSYKSPFLALTMSAVLPGSGKAYSGRWGDAVVSFLFVSTAAYASYRAFNRKGIRSFNGWLMGGISFSFYASNLYGSYKSAVRRNRAVISGYKDEAQRIIYSHF